MWGKKRIGEWRREVHEREWWGEGIYGGVLEWIL